MGPAFYVMAILGCGEAETACEPVTNVAAQYQTAEACNSAAPAAIEKHIDALYPVIVAQCRKAGSQVAGKIWADEVKLPSPEQRPSVRRAVYAAKARS